MVTNFDQHPFENELCRYEKVEQITVKGISRKNTPGCFVNGGIKKRRICLTIRTNSVNSAKHIARMFDSGAKIENTNVIVGVDFEHAETLYELMWHVQAHNTIDLELIKSKQIEAHQKAS
jgi:hypothetical protein